MNQDLKKSIKAIQFHIEDFQENRPPTFEEKVDKFLNEGAREAPSRKRDRKKEYLRPNTSLRKIVTKMHNK